VLGFGFHFGSGVESRQRSEHDERRVHTEDCASSLLVLYRPVVGKLGVFIFIGGVHTDGEGVNAVRGLFGECVVSNRNVQGKNYG